MRSPAFSIAASPSALRPGTSLLPRPSTISAPSPLSPARLRQMPSRAPPSRTRIIASSGSPEPPSGSGSNGGGNGGSKSGGGGKPPAEDDEVLQRELSAKVNELFGGRQNVTIDVDTDSNRAKFSVRRARGSMIGRGASVAEADGNIERNAALTVVKSVVVLSVAAGIIFTFLYYMGAVHGSSTADSRRYDMPTYGTSSYIDPYKLLEEERQAAEADQ